MENISLEYLDNICEGDTECVKEIIDEFLHYSPVDLDNLKNEREEDNRDGFAALLHKIKTPIMMFGGEKVKEEIIATEGQVKITQDLGALKSELDNAVVLIETVISEIKSYRESLT